MTGSVPLSPRKTRQRETTSQELDEALEETFPASDPIACSPKRGGKDDKRVDVAVAPEGANPETTDAKTASNMALFHKVFERRRR
jgi:hypothetical protein